MNNSGINPPASWADTMVLQLWGLTLISLTPELEVVLDQAFKKPYGMDPAQGGPNEFDIPDTEDAVYEFPQSKEENNLNWISVFMWNGFSVTPGITHGSNRILIEAKRNISIDFNRL